MKTSILSSFWVQFILIDIWSVILLCSGALDIGDRLKIGSLLLRTICILSIGAPIGFIMLWEEIKDRYKKRIESIEYNILYGNIPYYLIEGKIFFDRHNFLEITKKPEITEPILSIKDFLGFFAFNIFTSSLYIYFILK